MNNEEEYIYSRPQPLWRRHRFIRSKVIRTKTRVRKMKQRFNRFLERLNDRIFDNAAWYEEDLTLDGWD